MKNILMNSHFINITLIKAISVQDNRKKRTIYEKKSAKFKIK